ncbi:MAG: 16S rRNA (cytidine(1402)-2'-O)-methyltransferase [Burkholderiaceae bacterium]|nr:16S rRNA (cytidine(1402)-2'-O)-methyltransferase [Burkholderiaceae bacterium]
MSPGLYVVATPIGHLSDLSPRAAQTLCGVDVVAAEDTRVTRVLLRHAGSSARLISARAHNEQAAAQQIVALLGEGKTVALVSDAGTPAISDPGAQVVAAVRAAGFPVIPIPGPSALATLLSAAGLREGPIVFEGFLPARARARRERLAVLAQAARLSGAALVFYEAPHRIDELLADLADRFGPDRLLVIGRELTKVFEEIASVPAGQAVQWLSGKPERRRGEFVVAVERDPAPAAAPAAESDAPPAELDPQAQRLLGLLLTELPPSRAARLAHEISGAPRDALYSLALALRGQDAEAE